MTIAAMKQALEFLYRVRHWEEGKPDLHDTKEALRAAISEQEKCEPVATYAGRRETPKDTTEFWGYLWNYATELPQGTKLYTHPAPVPAGWQLVPVEPTPRMISAATESRITDTPWPVGVYKAMLAAAPKPGEMK